MIDFDGCAPLLLFGGPYSNLAATRALRAEADRLGIAPERVISTGDVVAYCAEPEQTVALVRDWGIRVIAGNCEEQLAAGSDDCACGFEAGSACDLLAKGWYPFAAARMSQGSRDWMATLPATLRFSYGGLTFLVVHGGVGQTNRFLFASQKSELAAEAAAAGTDVVVGGHCGIPFAVRAGPAVWFNPGVIGMPANDGTPAVWFGLATATADGVKLETRRLTYDHDGAAAALRRSGHANDYARTLVTGLWPSLDILPPAERAATGRRLRPRGILVQKRRTRVRPSNAFAVADREI